MSKYSLDNIMMPMSHFNSYLARGGGGGSSKPAPPPPPPPPKFTSTFPELKGKEYDTQEALTAAEAKVIAERQRKAEQEAAAARQKQMAQDATNLQAAQLRDPTSMVTKADVATIDPNAAGTTIADGTGQLTTPAPQITGATPTPAATVDPTKIGQDVEAVTSQVSAVQGRVSDEAQVTAAQGDPTQMASLQLDPVQIAQAQQVAPTPPRVIQPDEMISGSAVDMAAVNAATQVQAAQATPTAQATVQGQMAELMQDFEGSEPPAWAAGALRNATAQMAARGLGASSMAGQALVQAAMESALPIAMQDAQTNVQFEMANLSNRQQSAMFAAQQRAQFLELDFNQQFQTRVANAARIADVANMNFTAEQQIALENARMAQTVDITNLNATNAKIMADAAAMSQMDMANLNNRQQAAVANAQAFLAMDMKNMDFQQSTNMFKAQQNIQALFSDQAADNAAKQFNAASENQTNQFFANMATQVQQFNAGMTVQREQFNAQNALVVAQANAQWRQNTETINTAAQNEANRNEAMAANQFTQSTLDQVWQRERDIMDYAFRQSESSYDRALSVFLSDKADSMEKWKTAQANAQSDKAGKGYIFSRLVFG